MVGAIKKNKKNKGNGKKKPITRPNALEMAYPLRNKEGQQREGGEKKKGGGWWGGVTTIGVKRGGGPGTLIGATQKWS